MGRHAEENMKASCRCSVAGTNASFVHCSILRTASRQYQTRI
jgi:hypothetical protein